MTGLLTDGYQVVEQLVDANTVAVLRAAYDELLDGAVACPTDRQLGGITRQVMVPSMSHPVFADNAALDAGRSIVAELYGTPTAARTYDMLIYKPPGHPHETPWHQDGGYFGRPVAPPGTPITFRSVQFWLALDDADTENGCMHFVPGRPRTETLEHVVAAGDPDDEGRLVGLADPATQLDLSTAVACSLRAGGATMHLAGTPHYTPPNRSADRPRRAYIFNLDPADSPEHPAEQAIRESYVREIAAKQ
jgi:ectoine hydroxylase-related dioxygenase (phytanoyl-CoA dioxygenase family)